MDSVQISEAPARCRNAVGKRGIVVRIEPARTIGRGAASPASPPVLQVRVVHIDPCIEIGHDSAGAINADVPKGRGVYPVDVPSRRAGRPTVL